MRRLKVEEKYFLTQCIMNSQKCSICIKELEAEIFFLQKLLFIQRLFYWKNANAYIYSSKRHIPELFSWSCFRVAFSVLSQNWQFPESLLDGMASHHNNNNVIRQMYWYVLRSSQENCSANIFPFPFPSYIFIMFSYLYMGDHSQALVS